MVRGFSFRENATLRKNTLESFSTLLGEKIHTTRSTPVSFRDACQEHLTVLADEIKCSLSQKSLPGRGGIQFRLIPRLLENDEYKQFLGEAYAEEMMVSSTPLARALGLILFDLGVPSMSPCKTITPLPGGWLDLLVRGAQALIPEWRVSIMARKTSLVGKVEVLLCLERVDTNLPTLSRSDTDGSELVH